MCIAQFIVLTLTLKLNAPIWNNFDRCIRNITLDPSTVFLYDNKHKYLGNVANDCSNWAIRRTNCNSTT